MGSSGLRIPMIMALAMVLGSAVLAQPPEGPHQASGPWQDRQLLMREALARYLSLTTANNWQPLPAGPTLKPGVRNARILLLRQQLMQYGDYPLEENHTAAAVTDPALYDRRLQQAVKRFQRRHNLQDHGLIDPETRAQLNIPPQQRADTLQANLRRQHQMPRAPSGRHIVINIPEFTLRLLNGQREQLRMRIIVGTPQHQTPQLTSRLTHVVFNPTWTVPHSISVHELLPKGVTRLEADGYRLITHQGKRVAFSRRNLRALRLGRLALRQRAGADNTLGRLKFIIPNRQAIFLHDTNAKHLFDRKVPALSHGCIRLQLPGQLARLMLAGQGNWDETRLAAMTSGQRTRTLALKQPLPVYIVYRTAWVDARGLLHFRPDIYHRDREVSPAKPMGGGPVQNRR